MEVERRGSKGGFLNFFDWNNKSKSRKKLFSSRPGLDEGLPQRHKVANKLIEVDEVDESLMFRVGYDSNHASAVSSDEGYGTKAPGVVARLMGLDTLPSSSVTEPHSVSFSSFGSSVIGDSHYSKSDLDFLSDQIMEHDCRPKEFEPFSMYGVTPRPQQFPTRPIHRFQTEILPPKSSKTIPITHHKLLSPIKSPGFIPKKRAAYIMEAAAKFIESGPPSTSKAKMPSFGSSSVPMRFQDLKQKMEAAQKLSKPEKHKEPGVIGNMKLQPNNKRLNGLQDTPTPKGTDSKKLGSGSSNTKEKSVSLALQAKVNVQKREGFSTSSNRRDGLNSNSYTLSNQKEQSRLNSDRIYRSQAGTQRNAQKKTPIKKTPRVLTQNNQKQNCVSSKDKIPTRTSGSCRQAKKTLPSNGSSGPRKTVNTVVVNSDSGTRKVGAARNNTGKEFLYPQKNFSQKKGPVNQVTQVEESVDDKLLVNQDENSVKHHVAIGGSLHQEVDGRKNCMDVVSFTFTSPIKRSVPTMESSIQGTDQQKCSIDFYDGNNLPDLESSKPLTSGLNVISSDALSALLDQKLKELTCKVEKCNLVKAGNAAGTLSSLHDSASGLNVASTYSVELQRRLQRSPQKNNSDNLFDINSASTNSMVLKAEQDQEDYGLEEHCGHCDNGKAERLLNRQHHVSNLLREPSSPTGSCCSSDSGNSEKNSGTSHFSQTASEETISCLSSRISQTTDGDVELSDTASSLCDVAGRNTCTTSSAIDIGKSINWQLEYVIDVLSNVRLTNEQVLMGQSHEVLKPNIFAQLENQKYVSEQSQAEYLKHERKLWFDCVIECLDLRCQQSSSGSCKAWANWVTLPQKAGWLAEELHKETLVWRSMGELMVDDLVDKDMSNRYGKWIDFEVEAFEEGMQIENDMLACLVDELLDDLIVS